MGTLEIRSEDSSEGLVNTHFGSVTRALFNDVPIICLTTHVEVPFDDDLTELVVVAFPSALDDDDGDVTIVCPQ